MFGYVKANKAEMRVWEFETYKAVYCSLCRQLGKSFGPFARFTLSYDFVFLAILSLSLREGCDEFEKKCCAFNPLKKCNYCKPKNNDLELPAAAAMIMLYYKLKDNIADSKGLKKFGYTLLLPLYSRTRKKAAKMYPEIEKIVAQYISAQNILENENCQSLDKIAEPTSSALGKLFSLVSDDEGDKRALERLGYCMGKWIYILDAAEDFEEDLKSSAYNPLKFRYDKMLPPLEHAKERVLPLLNTCIAQAGLSIEVLNIHKYKGIIDNIVYAGMKNSQNDVFFKEKIK